jgi:PAS domain S-box-containing protein
VDRSEALDRVSDGVISVDSAWRYTYANRRAGEILGVHPTLLVGRYLWDLFPEGPEQPFYDACSQAMATQAPIHTSVYHVELDLWFEHRLYPDERGLSIIFRDITAQRSAEDAIQRQREVVEAVGAGRPLAAALSTLTRSFERGLPGALCSILLLDEDGAHLRVAAAPSLPDDFNDGVDGMAIGPKAGSCGTAAFFERPVLVADIETDPLWDDFRDLARRFGLRACWSSPIVGSGGVVLGTFAIYRRMPRLPSAREQRLIADAAQLAQLVIERQRAEAALQKSEELYRTLIRSYPRGVVLLFDRDLRVFMAEGRGFLEDPAQRNRLLTTTLWERYPRATADRVAAGYRAALAGEESVLDIEEAGRILTIRIVPLRLDSGPITMGMVIGVDVTTRRAAAAERERLLAELAAERSLLAAVLDHLPSAVLIAEAPSGRLIRGNARVEAIVGHPIRYSESTDGYAADWLTHDPARRQSGTNTGPLARAIREGVTTLGAEFRHPRPDHADAWVRVSAAPIRDPDGRITGGVVTAEDISAEKTLEAQRHQAQRMEVVGRLAGGIAHDFNNLLTVIQANADLTLEDLPEGHPAIESIEEVLTAADRAAQVTRQLLAFSGKQVLIPTQLDLDIVLADAEKHLREMLPPEITLTSALVGEAIGVRADHAQLEQVLRNLVVNARDALPGGGTIAMATGRELVGADVIWEQEPVRPGEYARMSVSDDGTGMDETTRARIFEPFFTTKPIGAGTGLGLSTVYGIVRQSEGWMRVESEVGRGTTISVLLPLVSGRPSSSAKEAAARGERRGTELVLLVEDEPLVRTSTRRVLERHGYRVVEAQHGLEALSLWEARRGEIDLVLTDVMMPELGGTELAERLRAIDAAVRVIFMSGYLGDDAATEGPSATREPFLQKPFTAESLTRHVRNALDKPPR